MARVGSAHAESRLALGAVLRDGVEKRRDLQFRARELHQRCSKHRLRERATRAALSRRAGFPERQDRPREAVGESVAARRRGVGRHWYRAARPALVVRHQLRSANRHLPAGSRVRRAIRQSTDADRKHPVR